MRMRISRSFCLCLRMIVRRPMSAMVEKDEETKMLLADRRPLCRPP
jgi:hypothetical protein